MNNWIVLSSIMFVSSIVYYLLIRKGGLLGIPIQLINVSQFFFPFLICLVISLITRQNFFLSFWHFILIIVAAIFFSFKGNQLLVKSISLSPNTGYPLIINKSYVILTVIVSFFLFKSELSIKKGIGILLIIVFLSLILGVFNNKTEMSTKKERKWIVLAFGSFFCTGLLIITSKYLFLQGISSQIFLTYIFLIGTICNIIAILSPKKREREKINWRIKNWPIIVMIGILSASFNYFLYRAMQISPNVGYVNGINTASIAFVTLFSILLFKDEFSIKKGIGIIGVVFGLILLLI